MRLAQILLPDASQYERKSQRIDAAGLRGKHELVDAAAAEVTHVYAREAYVTAGAIYPRWIWWKRAKKIIVSPVGETPLPEAVEDAYFDYRRVEGPPSSDTRRIGSFSRQSTKNMIEQTVARLQRFRSDVEWNLFDQAPSPAELAALDAWVDPADDEKDFDGFVAEALVVGLPVVASRTPINVRRLEEGRTGMLVPPRDPNEMTHAIIAVLFKQEVAISKQNSARQTVSKYRARQRLRVLTQLYGSLNS